MRLGQEMSGMWGIGKLLWGPVALAMATAFALCGAQAASASPQTQAVGDPLRLNQGISRHLAGRIAHILSLCPLPLNG
jgi:hypothetical protein